MVDKLYTVQFIPLPPTSTHAIMRIILSLVCATIGVLISIKSNWIVNNFGTVPWAEKHLGSSTLFWKLFGLLATIVAIFTMIGITDTVLISIFSRFTPKIN